MMDTSVTILIPTFNRVRSLQAVWPSYLADRSVKQIIVVNDGSTDETGEMVHSFQKNSPIPITLIDHPARLGQQRSRQTAIAATDTEWLLFGEDDVYLGEGYVQILLHQANQFNADIIAGRLVTALIPGEFSPNLLQDPPNVPDGPLFDISRFEANFAARPFSPIPAPYLHSISLVRKSLFEKISFDPWYRGNAHREETDFYLSANEQGYRVFFTPDAACFHLRGPICASGGQRINRIALEYWLFINSWHMVSKHWAYLHSVHGFRGNVASWILKHFVRRQFSQVRRILRTGFRSTFQGQNP